MGETVKGAQQRLASFPFFAIVGTEPPIDISRYDQHTDPSTSVNTSGGPMSRVQLALNVSDLDAAVEFYSKLFEAEPAKREARYANFAIADPPLKLVLIEQAGARGSGAGGALNHLGVEVETPQQVTRATRQLRGEGLETDEQIGTICCYAVQDKVWVEDPDGTAWEVYAVLADAQTETGIQGDGACCVSTDGAVTCC
jgi:catechol 2,3-dioxygenase-like lactoylglutathione lyase family enzyme